MPLLWLESADRVLIAVLLRLPVPLLHGPFSFGNGWSPCSNREWCRSIVNIFKVCSSFFWFQFFCFSSIFESLPLIYQMFLTARTIIFSSNKLWLPYQSHNLCSRTINWGLSVWTSWCFDADELRNQSNRAKSTIHLCYVYQQVLFTSWQLPGRKKMTRETHFIRK